MENNEKDVKKGYQPPIFDEALYKKYGEMSEAFTFEKVNVFFLFLSYGKGIAKSCNALKIPPKLIKFIAKESEEFFLAITDALNAAQLTHSRFLASLKASGAIQRLTQEVNPATLVLKYNEWESIGKAEDFSASLLIKALDCYLDSDEVALSLGLTSEEFQDILRVSKYANILKNKQDELNIKLFGNDNF